jgi:hypothetical protein
MSVVRRRNHARNTLRKLQLENLEIRQTLNADVDDQISEAISIQLQNDAPAVISATINVAVDVDMYKFQAAAGQSIDFDIDTATNGPAGLNSYIRIFNGQGIQLAVNNDAAAPGESRIGFDSYLRYRFPTAGTYYIGVSNLFNPGYNPVTGAGDTAGSQNVTGDYQLRVQTVPVDTDDSISEAINLGSISSTPVSRTGEISLDVDVDMYKFQVTAGQIIDFDIDTATNGPGGLGSFIRIFNSQGALLAANDDGAAPGESRIGFDSYFRYRFATAGTYYIGVSNWLNPGYDPITGDNDNPSWKHAVGSYQLTLQALPVDTDDAISEATVIGAINSTPREVNGEISIDVDVDMYRFQATAGQTIDFDIDTQLNGPGGLGSYLRIFNSNGGQLAANDDAAAPGETLGFDSFIRYRFPVAGTYFVGVSNWLNRGYSAITGDGDAWSWQHAIGSYKLILKNSAGSMMLFAGGGAPDVNAPNKPTTEDSTVLRNSQQAILRTSAATNQNQVELATAPNSSNASGSAESSDAWFARLGRQLPVRTEQVSSLSDFAWIDLG